MPQMSSLVSEFEAAAEPIVHIAGILALWVPVGCSSGGGGGSGTPPPGSGDPEVSFETGAAGVSEADGNASVVVRLSETSAETVLVPLSSSGSAVAGTHYTLDADELELVAGATEAALAVELLPAIPLFEPDIELVLELGQPTNAELVDPKVHRLEIRNDATFTESEPNDEVALANDVGGRIGAGRAGTILGAVAGPTSADPFDVFAVISLEDLSVELLLTPADPYADISLWVSDETGALTHMFESGGDGVPESGTIEVAADQTFYLVAVSLTTPTSYEFFVEGAEALLVAGPDGDGGRDPLLELGADWPAIVRALLLRKQGSPERATQVVGQGVLIEERAGRALEFLLEASRR